MEPLPGEKSSPVGAQSTNPSRLVSVKLIPRIVEYLMRMYGLAVDEDAQIVGRSLASDPAIPQSVESTSDSFFIAGIEVEGAVVLRRTFSVLERAIMCVHAKATCLSLDHTRAV